MKASESIPTKKECSPSDCLERTNFKLLSFLTQARVPDQTSMPQCLSLPNRIPTKTVQLRSSPVTTPPLPWPVPMPPRAATEHGRRPLPACYRKITLKIISISTSHYQSPTALLIAACALYVANNAQSVTAGPTWSPFSYVKWELTWWDNHLSVTALGGLIPPGQTSTYGI